MDEDTKKTDDNTVTGTKTEERRVPESALIKQSQEFQSQLAARDKELASAMKYKNDHEASQAKADEAKATAAGEFEKVLAKRDESIAELGKQILGFQRKEVVGVAKDDLRNRGMNDDLKIKGALTELPGDVSLEQVAEWTRALAEKNPEWFTKLPTPVAQSQTGSPHTGGGGDLRARLNSDDAKIKMTALKEQFEKQATGELSLDWNKG